MTGQVNLEFLRSVRLEEVSQPHGRRSVADNLSRCSFSMRIKDLLATELLACNLHFCTYETPVLSVLQQQKKVAWHLYAIASCLIPNWKLEALPVLRSAVHHGQSKSCHPMHAPCRYIITATLATSSAAGIEGQPHCGFLTTGAFRRKSACPPGSLAAFLFHVYRPFFSSFFPANQAIALLLC